LTFPFRLLLPTNDTISPSAVTHVLVSRRAPKQLRKSRATCQHPPVAGKVTWLFNGQADAFLGEVKPNVRIAAGVHEQL
jgi:hypothetical protein